VFTRLRHFEACWKNESASTSKLLRGLTDRSLQQAVTPMDRTLGRIAWHLTLTVPEMIRRTGLAVAGPPEDAPVPSAAKVIGDTYDVVSSSLLEEIRSHWTDDVLETEDEMYGNRWKKGLTLLVLVQHQTHHRGQMTVLMRQADLVVPGLYGPAREEWSAYGMAAPSI
jgi:uncharacterized damage-inducible protein DinB